MSDRSMLRTLATLAALIVGGVDSAGASAVVGNRPGPAPRDELITFARGTSAPGAPTQIWVMDGNGGEQREVSHTPAGASDTAPSLSLASAITVWQRTVAGRPQIASGDTFGDPPTVLTDFPTGASSPSISRRLLIAFTVGRGADCDVWVMNVLGGHQRRLTDHGGGAGCDSAPAFSPEGTRIAFLRTTPATSDHSARRRLLVIAASGGKPRAVPVGSLPVAAFSWGPGGRLLIVSGGAQPELVTVDPEHGGAAVLLRAPGLTGTPGCSPAGVRAAFTLRQADGSTDLFSISAGGGSLARLTRTPGISEDHPSWGYPSNQGSEPGAGVHAHSVPAGRSRRRR